MNLKKFTEILSAEKIGESNVCKYRLLNVTDSKVFALDLNEAPNSSISFSYSAFKRLVHSSTFVGTSLAKISFFTESISD